MNFESAEVAESRRRKTEFHGASKIEKGLKNFFLYRVAPIKRLNRLQPDMTGEDRTAHAFLERALFFTTQKEMATEYAIGKNRFLKIRGADFLEDLKNSGEDFECVLLDQKGITAYQRILRGDIKDEASMRGFFERNTHRLSDISLRKLRQAAEVIVLLPAGVHSLPFQKRHMRVTAISGDKRDLYNPGGYHRTKTQVAARVEGYFQKRNRKKEALQKEVRKLSGEREALVKEVSAESLSESDVKRSVLNARIKEMDKRLGELNWKLDDMKYSDPYGTSMYRLPGIKRSHRQQERQKGIGESAAA